MLNKVLTVLSLLTLLLNTAYAQNPPTGISDEGGTISYPAYVIDCVGAGITCSHSGSTATLTVSGSGSATITTQEQDVNVDTATGTIDFQECFDLTSSPSGEANVSFDSSECTVTANALKADGANCSAGEIPLGVDTAGAVQGCYEPSEADISDLDHTATAITDGLIVEADLNEDSGTPTDEDVLTYDSTGANFNWVAQSTLAAGTAASLAANGANCSSGNYPLGVDASGAVETCTADDDVPESGDFGAADDLETTGELSADVVDATKIADNAIQEEHLKAVDTAADEECLTYESTTGDFEWQTCGGGGASELSDLSDVNTSTPTNRNVLVADGVDFESRALVEADISDLTHTTDTNTNANTECSGTTTYYDGEGNCDDISSVYEPAGITESDISDLSHTTDTNANTACTGTTTYLDGEGNCDDIAPVYENELDNSAGLRAALSDETGTGAAYFVGGALGTPASGNGSNLTALNATQLTSGTVPAARVGTAHIDTATEIGNDIITHAQILDSDQADTKCFTFYESNGIDAEDDLESVWANKTANNFLITEIWCETDVGTVTAMLQVDDGTPADVDSVDLACTSSEVEDTSLNGDTTVAAGEELDWAVTSTATNPLFVRVCFTGNWVD